MPVTGGQRHESAWVSCRIGLLTTMAVKALLVAPLLVAVACAPVVSKQALSDSGSPPPVGYYYGAAQPAEFRQASPTESTAPSTKSAVRRAAKVEGEEKKDAASSPASSTAEQKETPAKPSEDNKSASPWAGDYLGRDTLKLELANRTAPPQVDDGAKLRVDVDGQRVTFVVVDSQEGQELCSVSGPLSADQAVIELEQVADCFSGLLPLPMQTELARGRCELASGELTLRFALDVTVATDELTLEGELEYEFVGKPQKKD